MQILLFIECLVKIEPVCFDQACEAATKTKKVCPDKVVVLIVCTFLSGLCFKWHLSWMSGKCAERNADDRTATFFDDTLLRLLLIGTIVGDENYLRLSLNCTATFANGSCSIETILFTNNEYYFGSCCTKNG